MKNIILEKIEKMRVASSKFNNELRSKGITKSPLSNPEIAEKIPTSKIKQPKGTKMTKKVRVHQFKEWMKFSNYMHKIK